MTNHDLVISKLEGYSGIKLKDNEPLVFNCGINLLVGRNGCGKTNLLRLVQQIADNRNDFIANRIESSYFLRRLKTSLHGKGGSIESRFGELTIVNHSIKGIKGSVKISLKGVPYDYVAKNLLKDGSRLQGNINVSIKSVPLHCTQIYSGQNPPKFEMSGYVHANILSKDSDNRVHSVMEGPIKTVSDFIRNRMLEFYSSDEFKTKILELENAINARFARFLGATNKEVKINLNDLEDSGRVFLSLMDNGNYVQSVDVSTGEAILLNLVFALSVAKDENCELLILDEPDIHMHDDMIQVLVNELYGLSRQLPQCIIVVVSHSTVFIERLAALGQGLVNIITFDSQRRISNTQTDIELINALSRNGVSFSPIMVSKRRNIFIENQLKSGKSQRDFLLKFFLTEERPNIIPIGNSGNVQDSEAFAGILEEILSASSLSSVGIQDGDIWFKVYLVDYLKGKLVLAKFVSALRQNNGAYIKGSTSPNSFFFNFWEIENLYLTKDLLPCWKLKNGESLSRMRYKEILEQNRHLISNEYFSTFHKSIVRIKLKKRGTTKELKGLLSRKLAGIHEIIKDSTTLEERMSDLVDAIFEFDLMSWVPGKEINKLLKKEGYSFQDYDFDFQGSKTSKQVREILKLGFNIEGRQLSK